MLTNKVSLDYLRLATYNMESFGEIAKAMQVIKPSSTSRKWIQYTGMGDDTHFFGHGLTNDGDDHYVAEVSGPESVHLFHYDFEWVYATRIDLQITCECPEWYEAREFKDAIYPQEAWAEKGRRRKPKLTESDTGHTVNIGSRDSDRYIRIYEKFGEDGRRYIRFEVEYKRKMAKSVYSDLKGAASLSSERLEFLLNSIVLSELRALPEVDIVNFFLVRLVMVMMQIGQKRLEPLKMFRH